MQLEFLSPGSSTFIFSGSFRQHRQIFDNMNDSYIDGDPGVVVWLAGGRLGRTTIIVRYQHTIIATSGKTRSGDACIFFFELLMLVIQYCDDRLYLSHTG